MSIAIQRFPLAHIQQLTLAEFISSTHSDKYLPCITSFKNDVWQVGERLIVKESDKDSLYEEINAPSTLELVVFCDS